MNSIVKGIREEVEKIRNEAAQESIGNKTEWLKSRVATCVDILTALDSLDDDLNSENKELSKEISRFIRKNIDKHFPTDDDVYIDECTWEDTIMEAARHFYEMGKKHGEEKTFVSPFTGGKATLKTKTTSVKFRGLVVPFERSYYHCEDTGHNYTDSKTDSDMMWSLFRKYWEMKNYIGLPDDQLNEDSIRKIIDIAKEVRLSFPELNYNIVPKSVFDDYYKRILEEYVAKKPSDTFNEANEEKWKPSEEQMANLKSAIDKFDFCDVEREGLIAIYNELDKIKNG